MVGSIRDVGNLVLLCAVVFVLFCAGSLVVTHIAFDQAASAVVNRSIAADQVADYRFELPYKVAPPRSLVLK